MPHLHDPPGWMLTSILVSRWVPVTLSKVASAGTPHNFRDIIVEEKAKIREMSQLRSTSDKLVRATGWGPAMGRVSVPPQQNQGSQGGTCIG